MSVLGAFSLFVVVILVYLVLVEMFTVLFRMTGMTADKARFQVMSMLTAVGYTTRESEMVTENRTRRKLAQAVMIFGYVFTVTIVSSLVNIFLAIKLIEIENVLLNLPWPILILVVLPIVRRNRKVKAWIDKTIESAADKLMTKKKGNTVLMLDEYGDMAVAQVHIYKTPERYVGIPLSEANLREDHNISVMVKKQEGKKAEAVDGDTVMSDGDMLVVFGPLDNIRRAFIVEEPKSEGED